MHLNYLLSKGHRSIDVEGNVVPDRMTIDGELWLGVRFPANERSELTINNPFNYNHIKSGSDDIGFYCSLKQSPKKIDPSNKVSLILKSGVGQRTKEVPVFSRQLQPAMMPNVLEMPDPFSKSSLSIVADQPAADIFFATSRRIERNSLYQLAVGTGVEIGPGPRPQIKNSQNTSVTYIEEKVAEEWLSLYNDDVDREAWSAENYQIGKAHDLPVSDNSLDFIFSSHVLEHLYNPLGHFDHWRDKLKDGGLVLGVVPSTDGTKDFLLPRTRMRELIHERQQGSFEIPVAAFRNWIAHHQPHHENLENVAREYFEKKFSIHVHVYDNMTIGDLLDYCVTDGGYSDYRLFYRRNSKDFTFALKK